MRRGHQHTAKRPVLHVSSRCTQRVWGSDMSVDHAVAPTGNLPDVVAHTSDLTPRTGLHPWRRREQRLTVPSTWPVPSVAENDATISNIAGKQRHLFERSRRQHTRRLIGEARRVGINGGHDDSGLGHGGGLQNAHDSSAHSAWTMNREARRARLTAVPVVVISRPGLVTAAPPATTNPPITATALILVP